MPGTRSSTRKANGSASLASQPTDNSNASTGSKRKSEASPPKAKRGRKADQKTQPTIEETLPVTQDKDVEMKEANEDKREAKDEGRTEESLKARDDAVDEKKANGDANGKPEVDSVKPEEVSTHATTESKVDDTGTEEADNRTKAEEENNAAAPDNAVEESSAREASTPSSILEKGIVYFFFRGRVGIDDPSNVKDLARSYIVLRPLPHGAKLGEGPIGDAGNNRLLALPKKVLPASGKDRFMVFVEKAQCSMDDIRESLASSDYVTKTAGDRHSPSATPIGEGVYAITSTGRESHLAYILTIPSELSEVQQDVGLRKRGSFVTSVKNPQHPGPANTGLPKGPEYPQEILDEFRRLRWMPLQAKHLDYINTQFLIIGSSHADIDNATAPQPEDEKNEKATPLEEMEELEHEDEIRVKHLKGDEAVFEDLGLSSEEYSRIQTTW